MPASPSKKIGINAELNVERMKELEEQLNDQARNHLAELRALNSRLAAYIERVRTLEVDNNRLEQQMTTIEETNTKEVISIRNMYDKELSQVHVYFTLVSRSFVD